MRTEKQRKLDTGCAVLFAVLFGVIFLFSLWTPLIADDYNYAFGYSTGTRIRSLRDIWISMAWHRKLLNPRVLAHGWLSLVLMYPRWVFAAINGAVAVFFSWTTEAFFREQGSRRSAGMTAMVWMLLWICMPGFGQVFFWTAGACNYFWGMAFSWFVICRVIHLQRQKENRWRSVLLLLLPTFAAGAWSEHISFAMLVILFLLLVRTWGRTGCFPREEAVLLLSGGTGYLFLMLAPSAKLFQRLHDAGDPTEQGVLTRILASVPSRAIPLAAAGLVLILAILVLVAKKRGRRTSLLLLAASGAVLSGAAFLVSACHAYEYEGIRGAVSSAPAGLSLALMICCAALTSALNRRTDTERILVSLIFAIGGVSGVALFLFGEYFPIRGFCAPVTLMILAAVYLAGPERGKSYHPRRTAVTGLVTVCFFLCLLLGGEDIYRVHLTAIEREAAFAEAAAGDKRVVLTPYPCRTKYSAQYGNQDLYPDAGWPNGVMADYYDVIRIIVIEE